MKADAAQRPPRVGLISLGCAKNLVDAEIMLGTLLKDGVEITNDAAAADVVIVNTCSFIDSAQEESVDTILESAELREAKNRGQGLIVSGCLPRAFWSWRWPCGLTWTRVRSTASACGLPGNAESKT